MRLTSFVTNTEVWCLGTDRFRLNAATSTSVWKFEHRTVNYKKTSHKICQSFDQTSYRGPLQILEHVYYIYMYVCRNAQGLCIKISKLFHVELMYLATVLNN